MIIVGFSTTNRLMSRVIRFATRGKVSHAWVAFDDPYLKLKFVAQAESWGYELRPWRRWLRENTLVAQFVPRASVTVMERALLRLVKRVGTPYDWRAALISGLFRWFKLAIHGRFRGSARRLMCSEAVVDFLKDAGLPLAADLDSERVTPAELFERMMQHPEQFKSWHAPGGSA